MCTFLSSLIFQFFFVLNEGEDGGRGRKTLGPSKILLGYKFGRHQRRLHHFSLAQPLEQNGGEMLSTPRQEPAEASLSSFPFPLDLNFGTKSDSLSKAGVSHSHLVLFHCVSNEFARTLGFFH